ncbi:MAG: arginine--tRNA ligase [Armatimonadetes bacterium RBG_16_58_9]|nr:MAG: arginine--tRNA ligase [Armatimonadetes bacterium RBG_16_58_9]
MIQDDVAKAISKILGTNEVAFNIPPKREFGDFSTAVCLAQAKARKRAPMLIAQDVKTELGKVKLPYIKEVTVTPPGYLNFKIDHRRYVKSVIDRVAKEASSFGCSNTGRKRKVLVEHTNVNPNKAMHIGHLRNAIIGDSLVRTLRKLNYEVEACNYIDDTGVQVADVVVAMLYMDEPVYDGKSSDFSKMWAKCDPSQPFDYWCWDIYSKVARTYETDEKLKARRTEVLHMVEAQNNPVARFAKEVATRIVKTHLATMGRLNVYYDLLNWESDIFLRGFWKTAFESLKSSGAVVHETQGPNAGCWVVRFGRGVFVTEDGVKSEDKVLVRSNGTVTYTGKDIAYQMWKFGVLGRDFLYKKWGTQPNGDRLWTTSPDGEHKDCFGSAGKVINVIDVRQSYTQQIVYDCLRKLGFAKQARNSVHLDYEIVVLSNAAASEIGVDVDAEEPGTQAMSGRKGLGVKGDDLIDAMVKRLSEKVHKEENAHVLAAAAIRYFMSRISTNKMIVFDFDEAMRTTGDTGVYCEYAHARACSILKKAGIHTFDGVEVPASVTVPEENLVKKIAELPSVIRNAGQELSPAPLARYAFELATLFTDFYETPDPDAEKQIPFIKIDDPVLRNYRLALVDTFRQAMANCLDALGIVPLERI